MKSYELAKAKLERLIQKWLGEYNPRLGGIEILFSEACDEVLADMEMRSQLPINHKRRVKPGTVLNAKLYIGKILKEEFGDYPVARMSDDEKTGEWARYVENYQRERMQELVQREKDPSVRVRGELLYNHWKHLSVVMQYAIKKGYREKSWNALNPDPVPEEGRKMTEEEKQAVLAQAKGAIKDQIILGLTMGLRLREILRQSFNPIHCCHVDLREKTLKVCAAHAKTKNSIRTIALSPQAYAVLMRRFQNKRRRGDYVFPAVGSNDKPANQNKSGWRTAKKRAGIEGKLKFHSLRHTFLSDCAKLVREGGISIATVCKYGGLTLKVFESVYLHMDHKDTEAVSRLIAIKLPEGDSSDAIIH